VLVLAHVKVPARLMPIFECDLPPAAALVLAA
jgi:hypothetical protein